MNNEQKFVYAFAGVCILFSGYILGMAGAWIKSHSTVTESSKAKPNMIVVNDTNQSYEVTLPKATGYKNHIIELDLPENSVTVRAGKGDTMVDSAGNFMGRYVMIGGEHLRFKSNGKNWRVLDSTPPDAGAGFIDSLPKTSSGTLPSNLYKGGTPLIFDSGKK